MKKILSLSLIAIFMMAISIIGSHDIVMAQTGENEFNTITVRGEGTIKVKPDIAYISIGVLTENKDAKVAQTENATKINKVISALKDMGIEEESIQTGNYSVYPIYDYDSKGPERITGYNVNNTINVTVRDILMVGDVLDVGIKEGANMSSGIQFSVSDTEGYYHEALKQAVNNAKGKADAIGEVLGVNIQAPSSVVEISYGGRAVLYKDEAQVTGKGLGSTPVETGELDINATVEVSYRY